MNRNEKLTYISENLEKLSELELENIADIIYAGKTYNKEKESRKALIEVSRILYEKNYNVSLDGNLSIRLSDKEILITPSHSHKGFIKPFDLLVTDYSGNVLRDEGKVSSEYRLHLTIYEHRPDVNAVIHAHSPYATACSLAGIDLTNQYITQPTVPTTDFALPSSPEGAKEVLRYVDEYNAVILNRHGVAVWGSDIWETFLKLEEVEHTSKMVMNAYSVEGLSPIDRENTKKLKELFREVKGLGNKADS
jgi:L-fuculose-phosphate aldolase